MKTYSETKTSRLGIEYLTEIHRFAVSMSEALEVATDKQLCREACEMCPRYGSCWACPPFDRYDFETLHPERFKQLELIVLRIHTKFNLPLDLAQNLLFEEKQSLLKSLRDEALSRNGKVYGFACSCDLCDDYCTRPFGQPCRHPRFAGPSLEAAGFNVGSLLENFTDIKLEWGKDGYAPAMITLVAGLALK